MNPHAQHPASPWELFVSFSRNRSLVWQMTKRDVVGRYRGSIMGLAWSFFNPILMLVVYTFVFSVAFNARWGVDAEESKADFAIILFVGLMVHSLFAECVNRAPSLVVSNANYVKKVVFPLEILCWVAMGSAFFHFLVSLLVFLLACFVLGFAVPWTAILLPVVIAPLILATMGLTWFLAATGVFVRDIAQTTGIITTVMMFLAPIFYPMSALPEKYQAMLLLNPLTFIIEEARQVLIWGKMPDWSGLAIYSVIGGLIAWMGFWWFQQTRKGFADVL